MGGHARHYNTADSSATRVSPLGTQVLVFVVLFFFFQAEDGIRDLTVTGVQTCALPIFELAAGQYQRDAKDLLFLGPPGVGKTHLVQALGYEAIKQGKDVFYRSIFDLVRDFMKDEAFNQQDKVLRRYLKPDLVIIDDMGLKQLPKHSGEYLLEVIMRRYENQSTIMTSNRPLEEWGKRLCDVPTAGAILDRFLHHAQVIP